MILRRLGNKSRIAKDTIKHFPPHKTYIEPFFGAGGIFFNKPKAKYNILNDLDSDVFNLFMCVMDRKEELEEAFRLMPIHQDLLNYWKVNKETDPIKKALRFLFLSNFTFLGKGNNIKFGTENPKHSFYKGIDKVFDSINNCQLTNVDFLSLFKTMQIRNTLNTFSYCDPPYLNTDNNYQEGFTKEQSASLFDTLIETRCKFAISEFNNPFVLDLAKQHNLEVITIGERQNLKNRRTEILVVNYQSPALYSLFSEVNMCFNPC